jgi:hypothetical protein
MSNSKRSVKSRGILAFACNTETTDYISIAEKTLKLAEKKLGLPTTLITDINYNIQNTRYDIDLGKFVEWKNFNRHAAYQLSPYDETIVIDADYLILDHSLLDIFQTEWDYLLQRKSHALTVEWPQTMGPNSLPFVWATVFAFRKTGRAELFFNLVARIQENYGYYKLLFNIQERNYRNDYAFAMADIIMNGYAINTDSIPGSMLAVNQPIQSIAKKDNQLIIRDTDRAYITPTTNLHIMSKTYLQSQDFAKFVNEQT